MNDNKKSREQLIKELSELRLENKTLKLRVADADKNVAANDKWMVSEKSLREIKRRYDELMEQTRDVIFVLSKEGVIVSFNRAFERITGWKVSEWIGKPFMTLLHPEDVPLAMERLSNAMKGNINQELEIRIQKKSGVYLNSEILSSPQMENGIIVGILGIGRDITDRKIVEKALKESEEKYRMISSLTTDYIFRLKVGENNSVKMDMISDNYTSITNRTMDEISDPELWSKIIHPDDLGRLKEGLHLLITEGGKYEIECRSFLYDGSLRSVVVVAHAIKNSDQGSTTAIIGAVKDITLRKKAEEALASERSLLRTLVDLLPAFVYVKDRDSRFLVANVACALYMGASSPQELIGKTDAEFYLAEAASDFRSDEINVLKGIPLVNKVEYGASSNGKQNILLTTKVPLRNTDGMIIGLVGTSIDITEAKRAENALRESEENFHVLFDENPLPTVLSEMHSGKITFVNKRMGIIMGVDPKDIIGKTANDLGLLRDPADQENLTRLIALQGFVDNLEIEKVLPDNQYGTDLVFMRLITINGKQYCLTVVQDITERKRAEEEIIRARKKAEESDRLKSAFLANMGHEIRTPMNGILGFSELLKNTTLTGKEQQEYVSLIEKSGARMLNIINDLIDISKIESGQMNVQISKFNINKQAEYIHAFFRPEAEAKGLRLSFLNSLASHEAFIDTDKQKVNAILMNLIKNAIKFTDHGSIEFGYSKNGNYLEFFVKDTGVGISPEKREIIFERFRQGSESLNRNYEGAGLGLSISKSFVEMLMGKIWMESNQGRGSTFYFTVPYNTVPVEKALSKNENSPAIRDIGKKLKILIAEDDEASGIFITKIVKNISDGNLIVRTGVEAVESCNQNPEIDLILMDIKMTEMDGYEATRKIREFNKDVIIIAQTAYAQVGERDNAISAGCNDYISKPINKDELLSLIGKHCKK